MMLVVIISYFPEKLIYDFIIQKTAEREKRWYYLYNEGSKLVSENYFWKKLLQCQQRLCQANVLSHPDS